MTTLAERIAARREELGLSQAELARAIGVSGATLSRWESGDSGPSRKNLESLAFALRTTSGALYSDSAPSVKLDPETLAKALQSLEQALGNTFTTLPPLQRAKLLSFVYATGGSIDALEASALLSLVG